MEYLVSYILAVAGVAVLVVWPDRGPSAWARDRVLRRVLSRRVAAAIDCYVCTAFWSGAALSPFWWQFDHRPWIWFGCLMTPPIFWVVLGHHQPHSIGHQPSDNAATAEDSP